MALVGVVFLVSVIEKYIDRGGVVWLGGGFHRYW